MTPGRGRTAAEIADLVGGDLIGPADTEIAGVASLDEAGPGDLAFLASARYLPYLRATRAGAVLVTPEFRSVTAGPATRIVVSDPRAAIQELLGQLHAAPTPVWTIHPTARVGRGARWSGRIAIGPYAVLGDRVQLGADCRIGAFARIGDEAVLGDGCELGAHVCIEAGTIVGDRVRAHPGARVGTPGFAFVQRDGAHRRIAHQGACRIGDDVEIGANTTIDRGSIGSTVIGEGTKIDNLVQIAHNVRIGTRCIVLAQAGIAGTTTIGDDVIVAGQAGLAGHLTVGDGARIGAQAGVIGDIPAGETVSGYPARPHRAVLRQAAALRRLTPIAGALERLVRDRDRD